jgi:hypothetical protein
MLSSVYSLSWIKYRTVCIANACLSMKVENMFLKFQICLISLESSRDVEKMTECFVVLERDAALDEFALSRLHL